MEGTEGGEQSQAAVRHLGGEELIKPCDAAGGCCHEIPAPASSLPVPPCCPLPATAHTQLGDVPAVPSGCTTTVHSAPLCLSRAQSSMSWPPSFQPMLERNFGAAQELGKGSEIRPALPKPSISVCALAAFSFVSAF